MHKLKREGFILVSIVPIVKTKSTATLKLCVTLDLFFKKSKKTKMQISTRMQTSTTKSDKLYC